MLETLCILPVQNLKGEYVRRKVDSKTTYLVEEYCRENKAWLLVDCNDTNKWMYVKTGTMLHAGFTY